MNRRMVFVLPCLLLWSMAWSQQVETGLAAYYADYLQGQVTALGETYDRVEYTCAHRFHPKGTLLEVTNLNNGKNVTVRVNDRGPYKEGYVVDLSLAAANAIDLTLTGTATVTVKPVGHSETNPGSNTRPAQASPNGQKNAFAFGGDSFASRSANPDPNFDVYAVRTIAPGQQGYVIQLGAYSEYDNAANQIISIQKMGVQSIYLLETPTHQGTTMYRVVLGIFDQRGPAEQFRERINKQYQLNGIVLRLQS